MYIGCSVNYLQNIETPRTFAVKKEKSPSGGYTPAHGSALYREKIDPNESLSMKSSCRPQYGSFQLKLLKILGNFEVYKLS
jgi:hypothetical protein